MRLSIGRAAAIVLAVFLISPLTTMPIDESGVWIRGYVRDTLNRFKNLGPRDVLAIVEKDTFHVTYANSEHEAVLANEFRYKVLHLYVRDQEYLQVSFPTITPELPAVWYKDTIWVKGRKNVARDFYFKATDYGDKSQFDSSMIMFRRALMLHAKEEYYRSWVQTVDTLFKAGMDLIGGVDSNLATIYAGDGLAALKANTRFDIYKQLGVALKQRCIDLLDSDTVGTELCGYALAAFDSAIALNPQHATSYHGKYEIQVAKGKSLAAIETLVQFFDSIPSPSTSLSTPVFLLEMLTSIEKLTGKGDSPDITETAFRDTVLNSDTYTWAWKTGRDLIRQNATALVDIKQVNRDRLLTAAGFAEKLLREKLDSGGKL